MIIREDKGKHALRAHGLKTPRGETATNGAVARRIASCLAGPCVVKALIPQGGRGKVGGVKKCPHPDDAEKAATALLGSNVQGCRVEMVLVEEACSIEQECYAAVLINQDKGCVDLLFSTTGGVDIEAAANSDTGVVHRLNVEPGDVLPLHRVRSWLSGAGVDTPDDFALYLTSLYRTAADADALLLEVNPLARLTDGSLAALDCKLEVDDSALVRQPNFLPLCDLELNEAEQVARKLGVSFVPLDGDIGIIASGAGLGMATMDMLRGAGLTPADFLDTGGGICAPMLEGALRLLLGQPGVKGVLINLYGGINRMLEAAQGIAAALRTCGYDRPVVAKILGNQQEEAWALLEGLKNVHVFKDVQSEKAVAHLSALLHRAPEEK